MYKGSENLFNFDFDAICENKTSWFSKEFLIKTASLRWTDLPDVIDSGEDMYFSIKGDG